MASNPVPDDGTVINIFEFKRKYGIRSASIMVELLIKRASEFKDGEGLIKGIAIMLADLESALQDVDATNVDADVVRFSERNKCIAKLESLPKGTWGDEDGEKCPWPIAIAALRGLK